MQYGVHAFEQRDHAFAVGQVAVHHFFARARFAQVGAVGKAHHVGPGAYALAQLLAQAAGGAGQQDAAKRFLLYFHRALLNSPCQR